MLSDTALQELKAIWKAEFGVDISDDLALEEGTNLLTMFNAVYRMLTQDDMDAYDRLRKAAVLVGSSTNLGDNK